MKLFGTFCKIFPALLVVGLMGSELSAAGETANIEVILVRAGNSGQGIDSSLKPYANTLERLFRFESYEQVKKQGVKVTIPGESNVSLRDGQTLAIIGESSSKGSVKASIEWKRGGQNLLRTRIQLRKGSPAVLGGPRSSDGTWLLILILR